jgi:hypothetical protein
MTAIFESQINRCLVINREFLSYLHALCAIRPSVSTMVACCLFDLFPVELLEQVFSYFRAHEIFNSFYNVSGYLNAVIEAYPNLSVHFDSTVHSLVDWTCRHLHADQIISMTVDNNPKTHAQYDIDQPVPGKTLLFAAINIVVHLL